LLGDNREGYGPREKYESLGKHFKEGREDQDLKRYYLEADMFDPRLENLKETFKLYEGVSAAKYLASNENQHWMHTRKKDEEHQIRRQQRNLIKDIFIAIDEDGNGTMEVDELIKALLSLCLVQDIAFAKQIINLFEEGNRIKEASR
jgi:hypothetical protein